MQTIIAILTVVSGASCISDSCTKILVIPGMLTPRITMEPFVKMINEKKPCSKAEIFIYGEGLATSLPLWQEIEGMTPRFLKYIEDNPQGITLVGVSQGGIVARGLVQTTSIHNVHTLFSFAGPQQGLCSLPIVSHYVPLLTTPPILHLESGVFYTPVLQNTFSLANLWKDPTKYNTYLKKNNFLPFLNNEKPHNRSDMFRNNLLKLKNFVLLGGDKDINVVPWQSNLWGYFDVDGQYPKIVNLTDQETYKNDSLGLRTMNEDGRIVLCVVPGANHMNIISDQWGLENCFLPYLV